MTSVLTCVLTSWTNGDPDDDLGVQKADLKLEGDNLDEAQFNLEAVKGRSFKLGLLKQPDTVLADVCKFCEKYPKKNEYITFGIPEDLTTVYLTLIYGVDKNGLRICVICCHRQTLQPKQLLQDCESGELDLAKYVLVPLPK